MRATNIKLLILRNKMDLLQSVKRDGHVLQSTGLLDEEQHGFPSRHAPQLLMHLGPMAEEVVRSTLR